MVNFWKPKIGKALKPSKINPWKVSLNKPAKAFYGDSDGDGVMNMFDCQPHNKKKQGSEHERAENRRANDMFDKAARNAEIAEEERQAREERKYIRKFQEEEED
jgi:hypothetical protein